MVYKPVWREEDENSAVSATPVSTSFSADRLAPAAVNVKSTSAGGMPMPGPGAGALPRSPPAEGAPTIGISAAAIRSRAPAGCQVAD